MMKCRKLIALISLLCCTALQVEAHAGELPSNEPVLSADVINTFKRNIQAVVRPDGYIVDRLVETQSSKSTATGSKLKQHDIPDSPEAWLIRMMDPSRNGLAMKHPELIAEWLDAVTEPRFMTALASFAVTPETYTSTLGKMADPATAKNWAEFVDPQIYLRWIASGADPHFYQAIVDRLSDGGKLKRWGFFLGSQATRMIHGAREQTSTVRETSALGGEMWLQLAPRDLKKNPWLSNSANYRY